MKRTVTPLNQSWRFALGAECPEDSAFQPVHLPHDWAAGRPIDREASLGAAQGWFSRKEIGWYRTAVSIHEIQPGRRFFLDFGGVFECAKVWVNNVFVGGQQYGYTPFRLDITQAVRQGKNSVLVRVDNTQEPADRWYSGCGIYRPVTMSETDEIYLDEKNIRIITQINGTRAAVTVETGLADAEAYAKLTAPDGSTAAEGRGAGNILLTVDHPRLWSAETPNLYTLQLALDSGDEVTTRIGLRTVEVSADEGIRVNGNPVKLRGVCLHQDVGFRGIAAAKEMWRDRLEALKSMGCNAIRAAHHMHSADFMDLCDEMGFYVYEECFDKWHSGLYGRYFDQDWEHDLSAMILRDRNRPSVIIWGVGNEVENQGQQSMADTLAMLTVGARQLDDSRPVSYAMNPHFKRKGKKIDFSKVRDIQKLVDEADEREITDMEERLDCISAIAAHVDVISCNYQEQWFEDIHRRIPNKPILSTEAYPFFMGHRDSMQNYTEIIPALEAERKDYVLGSFIWTGFDYLGESMGWPSKGWTGSLFRMDGEKRIAAYILKSRWTEEPMMHLSILDNGLGDELTKAHWAVPPYEDVWDFPELHQGVLPYMIATNCERVEIHLDGRIFYPPLLSENPNGYITGFVPWIPGEIEARGFRNGEQVCSHTLYTPGSPCRLELTPFGKRIPGAGEEWMVTAAVTDEQGHHCIRDNRTIRFETEGGAEILAVGNANLMETAPFSDNAYPAWHGKASVIIRRTGSGPACIIAKANGLEAGRMNI